MRVVVTGAAGFIGTALVKKLISRKSLLDRNGKQRDIQELILVDICKPTYKMNGTSAISTEWQQGDICDSSLRDDILSKPVDIIFHLAATLTAEAQADPSKGTRVNVRGFLDLLEACRGQAQAPRLIFASSIATFGGALPDVVDDEVVQKPQTSYGTHKVIAEQLINDYSRHGVIDGRALRLPIVLVRPPSYPSSVSDKVAAIVREPLSGRDYSCPFKPDTKLAVASVQRVVDGLISLLEAPLSVFQGTRAINLPALTVTPHEMVLSLSRVAGHHPIGNVQYAPELGSQEIVDSWPKYFDSEAARKAELSLDRSFDEIVSDYLKEKRK